MMFIVSFSFVWKCSFASSCFPTEYWYVLSPSLGSRLQREEEAAYACSHGAHSQSTAPQQHPGHASLGPFSKFEEKKTNEKTRKVTTVKKFFSPSSRTASKKGVSYSSVHFLYFVTGILAHSTNALLSYW